MQRATAVQAIAIRGDVQSACNATHIVEQRVGTSDAVGAPVALRGAACAYLASASDGAWIAGNATSLARLERDGRVRVLPLDADLSLLDVLAADATSLQAVTLTRELRRLDVDWSAGTVASAAVLGSLPASVRAAARAPGAADVLAVTSDAVLLNNRTVALAAPNETLRDVALWRCAPVLLSDARGVVVLSNVSLCPATAAPPRTFETAATTTTDDFETEPDESAGGVVPGFEGTVDARGAAKSRPPSLGLGVDAARRDVGFGPFSIAAVVVAVLAFAVLSALIARAVRNSVRLGRLAPNRANPWKTGD